MYAMLGKKCPWILLQTHLYLVCICLSRVDYMMANTFMYVGMISYYCNGMRIILTSYRVATIVEH